MTGYDKTLVFVIFCSCPNVSEPHIDSPQLRNITGPDNTMLIAICGDRGRYDEHVLLATAAKYAEANIEGHLEGGHDVPISLGHLSSLAL